MYIALKNYSEQRQQKHASLFLIPGRRFFVLWTLRSWWMTVAVLFHNKPPKYPIYYYSGQVVCVLCLMVLLVVGRGSSKWGGGREMTGRMDQYSAAKFLGNRFHSRTTDVMVVSKWGWKWKVICIAKDGGEWICWSVVYWWTNGNSNHLLIKQAPLWPDNGLRDLTI